MWIFTSGGALMPSLAPLDKADEQYTLGYRDFQVRARVRSHLENFIRDYMEPMGLDYSEIETTDSMDYDCRFYTTQSAFAMAMSLAIHDIDYKTFKDTSERRDRKGRLLYADGKAYHDVLYRVWAVMASLGNPYGRNFRYSTSSRSASSLFDYDADEVGTHSRFPAAKGKKGKRGKGSRRHGSSEPTFSGRCTEAGGYVPTSFGEAKHESKRTPPTAASLAAAGIADPQGVVDRWHEQEESEAEFLRQQEIEADMSDDEREDIAIAAEEAAMALIEHDSAVEDSHYEPDQLFAIARFLPVEKWDSFFSVDEVEYLEVQAKTWVMGQQKALESADNGTGEIPEPVLTMDQIKAAIVEVSIARAEAKSK